MKLLELCSLCLLFHFSALVIVLPTAFAADQPPDDCSSSGCLCYSISATVNMGKVTGKSAHKHKKPSFVNESDHASALKKAEVNCRAEFVKRPKKKKDIEADLAQSCEEQGGSLVCHNPVSCYADPQGVPNFEVVSVKTSNPIRQARGELGYVAQATIDCLCTKSAECCLGSSQCAGVDELISSASASTDGAASDDIENLLSFISEMEG